MAKKKTLQYDGPCPIASVMEVFGGKWKTTILYHLEKEGTLRFGELRRLIPAVSQRMLTLQLRELERDGLVVREQFPEIPPRVEYTATKVAKSLVTVFRTIEAWGAKNMGSIHKSQKSYDLKTE